MIRIRKAKLKDAKKISLLRRRTLREINKNDYPLIFLNALIDKNSTKYLAKKIKKVEIFCAWEGKLLVGTVQLDGNKIGGLYIKTSQIGKGIGTKLMDFIEMYAKSKGIKKVKLYSTKFAFNFYKKRGYNLLRSGYWVIGKSKIKDKLMEKKL